MSSLINYCSPVQNNLQLADILAAVALNYLLFCCHLVIAPGLQTETAVRGQELTWKAKCHNFWNFSSNIISYHDKIGTKQWHYGRAGPKMGNYVGHASLRGRHNLKLQLPSLISSPQKNFWTFFWDHLKAISDLANKSGLPPTMKTRLV